MNTKNQGLKFEKEFGEGLKQSYLFVVKFPDTRSLRWKQKIVEQQKGLKFHQVTGLRAPADYWTLKDGHSVLWECKQSKGVNKNFDFPTANVKEHQIISLKKHFDNGGDSYVVINIKNKFLCEYYCIPIYKYAHLAKNKASISRKNLKWRSVADYERLTPTKSPTGVTMIKCI